MLKRLKMISGRIVMMFLPLQAFPAMNRCILRWMGHTIKNGVVFYSSSEIIGLVKVHIGENSFFGHKSLIMGGTSNVVIGSNCDISSKVSIITGTHEIGFAERRAGQGYSKDISIGNGTWVGYGVIIIGGASIGAGCVIAAGSLVNKNIPSNTIAAGVPAKVIRTLNTE